MGPVLQHQAVPDNARTRGAEQSQLEGTAARTVQQRGRWCCIWGAELTVITSGEPVILNAPPSHWADCLWSSLEMWMGSWGERTLLLTAEGSEWRQHYLFPRFPLLDHLNPLFNYKTRTYSNMHLAFVWNLEYAKPSGSEPKGITKFCRKFCGGPRASRSIMKLEPKPSAEIFGI